MQLKTKKDWQFPNRTDGGTSEEIYAHLEVEGRASARPESVLYVAKQD